MLLTENLNIIVDNGKRKYYKELGYDIPIYRDPLININIKDLPHSSNQKIKCICDICGNENEITYYHYNKNIKKYGYYSCKGICSRIKFKATCIELFNCENPFQNEEIKNKSKQTLIQKTGFDNSSKTKSVKEKHTIRNLELYDVPTYFQSEEFKLKSQSTIKQKYGVSNVMHN